MFKRKFVIKKGYVLLLMTILISLLAFSQEQEQTSQGFDKSRLFFGGNFGLSFGTYTFINVTPQVGYHLSNYFAVGTGINFIYSSTKYYPGSIYEYKSEYGAVGLNIFGRFYPIQYIMLHAQPELNYVWGKQTFSDGSPSIKIANRVVPSLLLGGGVIIPAGRGSLIASLLYDVIQDRDSPYYGFPVFGFGFNIGF
ncbi:MAG: hypothetical protein ACHQET_03780 [Chitinophagales bacterium]